MTVVNVGDMSREELENAVLRQAVQLKILMDANTSLKANLEKSEREYEVLANVVLAARSVLSC